MVKRIMKTSEELIKEHNEKVSNEICIYTDELYKVMMDIATTCVGGVYDQKLFELKNFIEACKSYQEFFGDKILVDEETAGDLYG